MKEPLRILVDHEQPESKRIEAAKALGRTGERSAIDRMLDVVDRSETLLGRAVVEALREMGAYEVLLDRMRGPDVAVRAAAARSLATVRDERSIDALIAARDDPEPAVRRGVLLALSQLKGPKVFDALVASLRDSDPETRSYAAAGLGRSGDPRAARTLFAAREAEEDDIVRDFIEAALRKLPKDPAATR